MEHDAGSQSYTETDDLQRQALTLESTAMINKIRHMYVIVRRHHPVAHSSCCATIKTMWQPPWFAD
jgi:hypothetical protein